MLGHNMIYPLIIYATSLTWITIHSQYATPTTVYSQQGTPTSLLVMAFSKPLDPTQIIFNNHYEPEAHYMCIKKTFGH